MRWGYEMREDETFFCVLINHQPRYAFFFVLLPTLFTTCTIRRGSLVVYVFILLHFFFFFENDFVCMYRRWICG